MSKEYDERLKKADAEFARAHRDDIATRIFIAMMGKYPNDDPAEYVAKARAAADVLLAELDKPRAEPHA